MSRPRFVIKGHKELLRKLQNLGSASTAARVLRKVTNAATTPMLKAVRDNMPVASGGLKKAVAKKISGRNFKFNGRVGVDTSKMTTPTGEHEKPERVARHLHLVEKGFEHIGGKVVPGQHPLQKGFDSSQAQCLAVYEEKLAEAIESEAKKG